MSTAYHARLWAESLSLAGANGDVDQISRSLASAKVDLNPHQIDAALFAVRSPLSTGAMLADEVGLGKTIEACLVMLQRWAERRRRILLVLPATLRTQWQAELSSKFGLPAVILEAASYNRARKSGVANPFEQDAIIITSYHFAAKESRAVARVPWDLVVVDEAHRLRNVHKPTAKVSRAILDATAGRPKILLTATPLQNSLMELYGLSLYLDPLLFGDVDSFREQFVAVRSERERNTKLRERLKSVCFRTLRKQVTAYVRFTARLPITQEFVPSDAEHGLYEDVSAFLQRERLHALPPGQRTLMTLVLRKLLASSSFAIAATLRRLVARLETMSADVTAEAVAGEDMEALAEMADEWDEDEEDPRAAAQRQAAGIAEELAVLRQFATQAEAIDQNAKGQALLQGLTVAFDRLASLGAQRKAVIFTESRRTQEYLAGLLTANGYGGRIVLINGTNSDPGSKAIHQGWKARHGVGKQPKTGSVSADVKAALVEEFASDRASILLATESAAEGVNLQFCSLVVNYDLPWNPQRVEQRIGRCHRYGQQHDVVVVNFLNKRNEADQRVYQLLAEKFRLFDGVFGASDEVLGSLESGVDLERRISEVYQACRTPAEIAAAFDRLQAEVDEAIQSRMAETRRTILDNFDAEVHDRLAIHHDRSKEALGRIQADLLSLLRQELPAARFEPDRPAFEHEGRRYCLDWRQAEARDEEFVGPNHGLPTTVVDRVRGRPLEVAHLRFDRAGHPVRIAALDPLAGRSGWLSCATLVVAHANQEEFLILVGVRDDGVELDEEQVRKLFLLGATVETGVELPLGDPTAGLEGARVGRHVAEVERRNAAFFDEQSKKLDDWADDRKLALDQAIKQIGIDIKVARNQVPLAPTLAEKAAVLRRIKDLEVQRTAKRRELFEAEDGIEAERDTMLADIERRLRQTHDLRRAFLVRWSIT